MKSATKKRIIAYILILPILAVLVYTYTPDWVAQREVNKLEAAALAAYPWTTAGQVTTFMPGCAIVQGACTCTQCPMTSCAGHSMIVFTPQAGGQPFICYLNGVTQIKGGAGVPIVGQQFMAGGYGPLGAMVAEIGVPSYDPFTSYSPYGDQVMIR